MILAPVQAIESGLLFIIISAVILAAAVAWMIRTRRSPDWTRPLPL
jgi:hypothetical protein